MKTAGELAVGIDFVFTFNCVNRYLVMHIEKITLERREILYLRFK